MKQMRAMYTVSLFLAPALCCIAGSTAPAYAQTSRVVVPALAEAEPVELIVAAVRVLEAELNGLASQVPWMTNADAALSIETLHSTPPVAMTESRLSSLNKTLTKARDALAYRRASEARPLLVELDALQGAEREYLRRDADRAQMLFDTCLMRALALSREQLRTQAEREMLSCVRGYPGLQPPDGELRALFDAAFERARREPHGTLEVSGAAGCTVRLNGLDVGTSPARLEYVPVGPMQVQLECAPEAAGRRHAVMIVPGPNRVSIDSQLDSALLTSEPLALKYPDSRSRSARIEHDVAALTSILDAQILALKVKSVRADAFVALVITGSPARELGVLHYSRDSGFQHQELKSILDSLEAPPDAAEAHNAAASAEVGSRSRTPATSPRTDPPPSALAGGVVGVIGVGLAVAAGIIYAKRQSVRLRQWPEVTPEITDDFHARGDLALALGVSGSASLVAAEYLALPEHGSVPAAAWIAGGAGAVIAAVGTGYWLGRARCEPQAFVPGSRIIRECQSSTADPLFGPVLLLAAAPLLNVPLTYALRNLFRSDHSTLTVSLGGVGELSVRGTF